MHWASTTFKDSLFSWRRRPECRFCMLVMLSELCAFLISIYPVHSPSFFKVSFTSEWCVSLQRFTWVRLLVVWLVFLNKNLASHFVNFHINLERSRVRQLLGLQCSLTTFESDGPLIAIIYLGKKIPHHNQLCVCFPSRVAGRFTVPPEKLSQCLCCYACRPVKWETQLHVLAWCYHGPPKWVCHYAWTWEQAGNNNSLATSDKRRYPAPMRCTFQKTHCKFWRVWICCYSHPTDLQPPRADVPQAVARRELSGCVIKRNRFLSGHTPGSNEYSKRSPLALSIFHLVIVDHNVRSAFSPWQEQQSVQRKQRSLYLHLSISCLGNSVPLLFCRY